MKKILLYIILVAPWFLSTLLFKNCLPYFDTLNLPWFALPKPLYGIFWTILYLLIAFSIYKIYKEYRFKDLKNFNTTLLVNYVFNQLYLGVFFCLKNPLLGLIDCILILITSLLLYVETKSLNEDSAKLLVPYWIFSIYASILSLFIYFMNL